MEQPPQMPTEKSGVVIKGNAYARAPAFKPKMPAPANPKHNYCVACRHHQRHRAHSYKTGCARNAHAAAKIAPKNDNNFGHIPPPVPLDNPAYILGRSHNTVMGLW